ncbi:hypothetical protein HMF8227_00282 [Saliniradius amylolyticus]|uniref:MSHA pilin protein MshC n=1 Tax=Saliniradius amylolyticus TaxID=2183582 RepID=A0A2S2E0H7_9ALTE|nr:type II secretion system protein [Saliniradius amylolyticus]AWL10790.1 hypothetical protein HMF8227_00282 [Saliniradius amylolyticus]
MRGKSGFTLIELVIVITILGVIAVTAIPRFANKNNFSISSYQNRLISSLRNMQQRAMQDTRPDFCHQVVFDTGSTPAFGPPSLDYSVGTTPPAGTCDTNIDYSGPEYLRTSVNELVEDGVTISLTGLTTHVGFNTRGQPVVGASQSRVCSSGCRIDLNDRAVCIESEGYIHAC